MAKKKSNASCQIDHLELRRLLSTIYVSASATGANNGSSWADAYRDLQTAITAAHSGTVVDVGQGTYTPGTDRTDTFHLADGVTLEGGFAGTGQPFPNAHNDTSFPSILSGDIGTTGVKTDNIYNVVTGSGSDSSAVLNGFTVSGGYANGTHYYDGGGIHNVSGSPTISYCVIQNNYADSGGGGISNFSSSPTITHCTITDDTSGSSGGGMENLGTSAPMVSFCDFSDNSASQSESGGAVDNSFNTAPTFMNCSFTGNSAGIGGAVENFESTTSFENCIFSGNSAHFAAGAIANINCSPNLINCVLSGNTAQTDKGGAMYNQDASPTLTNCTISGNTAVIGGALANSQSDSSPIMTNCILWGNTATTYNEIYNRDATATVTYSDIDQSGFSNTGDVDTDPLFVDAVGTHGSTDFGDLHLTINSPLINTGSNAAVTNIPTDLDGNPRITGSTVDLGAYEFINALYVDASATGTADGSNWTNAYTNLQTALSNLGGKIVVEVAQGTYTPTTTTDRTATFQLVDGVTIYGGYAGGTTSNPSTRDVSLYETILSGDIGTAEDNSDNSYHVVTASGTDSTAVLDGFTISDGNANTTTKNYGQEGGGIINVSGSPLINDCTFSGNRASLSGGGMDDEISGQSNPLPSSPTLTNCTFINNTAVAAKGGGMYNGDNSTPSLTDCTFTGNTADMGGGMENFFCSPTLINCTFDTNTATNGDGGGLMNVVASPILTGCVFINNSSGDNGGGLSNENASSPAITNCSFTTNSSTSVGGGMYNFDSAPTIQDCVFNGNSAGIFGGGMYNAFSASPSLVNCTFSENAAADGGAMVNDASSSTSTNCTFTGNTASSSGGAIFNFGTDSPLIVNCILWGDSAQSDNEIFNSTSAAAPSVTFSDVEGGSNGTGNINAGPQFFRSAGTNGSTDYGDLRIAGASPAVNVGSNTAVSGVNTDLAGHARIVANTVDMGAYESQALQLVIATQPVTGTTAGGNISVVVDVEDVNGHTITGDNSNITIGLASGSGLLTGTLTATANNGVATFNNLVLTKAGGYKLAISGGSLSPAQSINFTINPAAGTKLVFVSQPVGTGAGQTLADFTIDVQDPFGNIATADASSITVSSNPSGAMSTVATHNGAAAFSTLSFTKAGTYTLSATDESLTTAQSSTFTITPGAPASLVISQEPADSAVGQTIPDINVDVNDQFGNLTDGSSVTLAIATGTSGASLGGTKTVATSGGIADFSDLTLDLAGTYTLAASDGSLPIVDSTSFNVTQIVATQLVFGSEPASATAGQTLSSFMVDVESANGQIVSSDNSNVSIAILTGPDGASLGGTLTVTAHNGVATFSDLSIEKAGAYTLAVSDDSLASASSQSFVISPGQAANLLITTQPANGTANQSLSGVAFEVTDQFGNPTDGSTISVSIANGSAGATLRGTLNIPTTNGLASFANLNLDRPGTYTLAASNGALSATTNSFAITYAGPQLVFVTEPTNIVAGAKIPAFHVSPEDISGNPLLTNKSKITIRSSAGKLLGTSTASVKNGVAIFKNLSFQQAGSYTFQVTDSGFGSALSNTITVSPAAAAKMVFTPQPSSVAHDTPFNVTVDLFDRYGNLATNNSSTVELTLGSKPKSATFTNLMASATDGAADFDGAILTVPGNYTLDAIDGKLKAKSGKFVVN